MPTHLPIKYAIIYSMKKWLEFFRVVNLPSVPGDVLAGAAVASAVMKVATGQLACLAATAVFLYMFGLADNDIVGAKTDTDRPIARGEISLRSAKVARALCIIAAAIALAATNIEAARIVASALAGCIVLYNRIKSVWLMGLCRGLSVMLGASIAAWQNAWPLALGITLYIVAVTKLSEGEEHASEGLGNRRYIFGLAAFAPLAQLLLTYPPVWLPAGNAWHVPPYPFLFPLLGCVAAFAVWCEAVKPLWQAHEGAARKAAVGKAISAIIYIQIGFMLPRFTLAALAIIICSHFIHHYNKGITGS